MDYILDYKVSAPQKLFLESKKPYRLFVGGIGSGKTFSGAMALLREKKSVGMVVTPTHDMAEVPFRAINDIAGPLVKRTILSKGSRYMELTSGHEIYFRSADRPDRLRGPNLGWVWIDEAGQLEDDEVWKICLGRLRLKPGRAWMTTTPKGFNWLYHLVQSVDEKDSFDVIKASSKSNTFIQNKSFIDLITNTYDEQFAKQELEGEFISLDSVLFKSEYIIKEDIASLYNLQVTAGVDLAISEKETAAYTAIAVMARNPSTGIIYAVHVERFRQEFHEILKSIERVAIQYKPFVIAIENVQFQAAVIQELKRTTKLNIRSVSADKDKVTRFRPLLAQYEKKNVRHNSNLPSYFADELMSFPDSKYKDCVDAASYAYLSLPASTNYYYSTTKQRDYKFV